MIKLSPRLAYVLVLIAASCNISILSYDASMINNLNAIQVYLAHFNLNASLIGLNTAIVAAGSIAAGFFVGSVLDKWGRRSGLMVGSSIVLVGVILQASATTEVQFVIGRFLIGIASTINGSAAPMWVMELSSPKNRAVLSGVLMTTLPFVGTIVCILVLGIHGYNTNWAWRGTVLGEGLPPIICLCILPFTDESPRWLIYQNREEEALEILVRLHAGGNHQDPLVAAEFKEIQDTLTHEKENEGNWKGLFIPATNFRRFGIAVLVNIFFQISGPNMMLYFFSIIVAGAGVTSTETTLLLNLGIALWDTLCVLVGGYLVDRFGRKQALIWATSEMSLCFGILAGLMYLAEARGSSSYGIGAIVVVFLFQIGSCSTWMILAYTYPPEVLRYSQRAKGVAISQAVGYLFSFINLYFTPIAIEKISWRYYAINGGWNLVIVVLIWWLFVETKGRTLEEIDEIFDGAVHTDGIMIGDGKTIVIEGQKVRASLEATEVEHMDKKSD